MQLNEMMYPLKCC